MRIVIPDKHDDVLLGAVRAFTRQVEKRTGQWPEVNANVSAGEDDVVLSLSAELAPEEFEIIPNGKGARVVGGSSAAVIYGCGRLLRVARFNGQSVDFGRVRERLAPEKPIRGAYFATHFYNYYHTAPLNELQNYIDELALWGINTLTVWFDMNHFSGIDDPGAQELIGRLKAMHSFAQSVGMKVGLLVVANETYADSPVELRADQRGFTTFAFGIELCPSRPEAMQILRRNFEEEFSEFDQLDYLWIWPYDSGGCGCENCRPWGANGFLRMGEEISRIFRRHHPNGKIILSTWLFDYPGNVSSGEWDGLYRRLEDDLEWVDIVMADGHKEYPRPPLARPLPKGRLIVNFPEISMIDMSHWGAYGVNPLPAHWEKMWDVVGDHIAGSFPYSEGIYEDINKVLWAQKNWSGSRSTADILREYAAYEFAPEEADRIVQAIQMMEETHYRTYTPEANDGAIYAPNLDKAPEIWRIISDVDSCLPEWARSGWRWRFVYLRAAIDVELLSGGGRPTPKLLEYFGETRRINHVEERTRFSLKPPFG